MAKITSRAPCLYHFLLILLLLRSKSFPCAETALRWHIIYSHPVMLRPKSQAECHPTVNTVLPISLSQPVPLSRLRSQPPLQIVSPMTIFSVGDNKLQSNEGKILLLSPHHSPHKVKVMHLHTGFFFFCNCNCRAMEDNEELGKEALNCKRGWDAEGHEENDKTKVHFEKLLPRGKVKKEQASHYSVWQGQKLGTHYTGRTEPTWTGRHRDSEHFTSTQRSLCN